MKKIINIANAITLMRILLIPWLIVSYTRGVYAAAGYIITVMCLSDFLDGKIARARGTASAFGALLDVGADCVLVFIFQGVLIVSNDWPLLIFIFSLLSMATFLFGNLVQQGFKLGRIGRYCGGLIMLLFFFRIITKCPLPLLLNRLTQYFEPFVILILSLSIIENISILLRNQFYSKRRINCERN